MLQKIMIPNKCCYFYSSKDTAKIYHVFHKNMKHRNCFQHW